MLDYQRIVDDVRSLLCVQGADAMDFLRAAAADYSVACDEVNERLHQCASLLRQGLRSEAIQVAEIEPNLLDTAALLDFPERPEWVGAAGRLGIAAPAPLLVDVAAQLNEAYALEQPLSSLLQRHRLLALARGPLGERIGVLRALADMDAGNPVWQEDLRIFEEERQKQIAAEVQAALHGQDAVALAALNEELSDPLWRNPPPPELAHSAGEAHNRLRYWAVQTQFNQLADELDAARSHFQVIEGRAAREQWNQTIASTGWQPQEAIAQRAAAALSWLMQRDEADRKEQQYDAAIDALAAAAGHGKSLAELKERHRTARKLGKVPPEVEEHYRTRLAILERAARLRRWLFGAGVTAGAAVLVLLVGLLVSHQDYERQVAAAVEALPQMLQSRQYDRAEALVRDLPKRIAQDPRVREWTGQLQKELKKDGSRHSEFAQRIGDAKHWQDQILKSLDGDPSQTVLDRLRDELDHSRDDLERAGGLARTDEDRKAVADAKQFAGQVADKWQRQIDQAFEGEYAEFDKRLTQVDRDKFSRLDALKAKLADLSEGLSRWERTSGRVSLALQPRITTLKEHLTAAEKKLQQWQQQEEDEKLVTAAVGDIPAYAKALQTFIGHHPEADTKADLKRAAEESLCWQAVAEWNKLASQSNGGGIARLTPATAQELAALAGTVAENFSACSEGASVSELLPYLKAIAQRDDGGQRIDAPLKKLFAAPLVRDVWMIEKEDGARYYVSEKPETGQAFDYLIGFDGKTRRRNLPEWQNAKIERAPQVAVAETVQSLLQSLTDENWEPSFYKMIHAIHGNGPTNPSMDPILKANLLQQVLEAGVRGSHCLQKAFQPHLEWFNQQKINAFANWLDPADGAANVARSEAARKLREFPDIIEPGKAAAEDLKTLRQRRLAEYRWVGWLHGTRDGRWECLMPKAPAQSGPLWVVYRNASSEKPRFGAVGRFSGLIATIDTAAELVAGRPVFLQVP